jgi:hypothetical protein
MPAKEQYLEQLGQTCSKGSATASEVARKIAFGGAAVCWFFKDEHLRFPTLVLIALGCLCVYFLFDLGQYYVRWRLDSRLFDRVHRDQVPLENLAGLDRRNSRIQDIFFSLKLLWLAVAFGLLGAEILRRL